MPPINAMDDSEISKLYTEKFSASLEVQAQFRKPVLWSLFEGQVKEQTSEIENYRQILADEDGVQKDDTFFGDTQFGSTKFDCRQLYLESYDKAYPLERKTLSKTDWLNPRNDYAQMIIGAKNRKKDQVIIEALLGNAIAGNYASNSKEIRVVSLPDTQKIVCTNPEHTGLGELYAKFFPILLNKFDNNLVGTEESNVAEEMKYFIFGANQKTQLLLDDYVSDSDFSFSKALATGKIFEFGGFNFIMSSSLPVNAEDVWFDPKTGAVGPHDGTHTVQIKKGGAKVCIAFVLSALTVAQGPKVNSFDRIDVRPDKKYNFQVYGCMEVGATRMWEDRVIAVYVSDKVVQAGKKA